MQIDINYARAYIYNLIITKMTNKKYQTVSKKTIDIILNEIVNYYEQKEDLTIEFTNDEKIEKVFNQVFYDDKEDLIPRKNATEGMSDLSIFLLCAKSKAAKQGDLLEITNFDNYALEYYLTNTSMFNRVVEADDKKVQKQINSLIECYKYIHRAYYEYYMSDNPIMHTRYKLAEVIKKRNKLLNRLSKDSVVLEEFQSYPSKRTSFLNKNYCYFRIKEDSYLYGIKHDSENRFNTNLSKQEFLLYVEQIQQTKYYHNIKQILASGVLDMYPNEKKFIEIQFVANSIIPENLFFYKDEEWLDYERISDCSSINPSNIYKLWQNTISQEIKSILSISDTEYRNNGALFARKLNSTMIIKSFADISPDIFDKINQVIREEPQFYHSSHKIGRTLLRDFSNLGGDYDKSIKKIMTIVNN